MKAFLRSVRIAPKKANLVASMVRDMPVTEALDILEHTNKKGARILETLLRSAIANAENNDKQRRGNLVVRSLIVNKSQTFHRGVPMARGRVRPMRKFLSHIELTLGVAGQEQEEAVATSTKKKTTKTAAVKNTKTKEAASQTALKTVQKKRTPSKRTSASSESSESSTSSVSS